MLAYVLIIFYTTILLITVPTIELVFKNKEILYSL